MSDGASLRWSTNSPAFDAKRGRRQGRFRHPRGSRPFSCVSFRQRRAETLPARSGGKIHMTIQVHARVGEVTNRIIERSRPSRQAYLARLNSAVAKGPARKRLGCANLAHGFAACGTGDKEALRKGTGPIWRSSPPITTCSPPISRTNAIPNLIQEAARAIGGAARSRAAFPPCATASPRARAGMELSLFSRDVIALSMAVALSHEMFDAAVYLGVCDKIVPGLVIGALSFGHLPAIFIPAGPMPSGVPNDEKSKSVSSSPRGRLVARDCWRQRRNPITRQAPAPFTAPPIPTRC